MKVIVEKNEIMRVIEKNRESHRTIFKEAIEGYRKKALEVLQQHIKEIEAGKFFTYISMTQPEDHTRDYDRVLDMLKRHQDSEISLSEPDYAMYVLDDWQWKRQFLTSNSQYSSTAAAALRAEPEE